MATTPPVPSAAALLNEEEHDDPSTRQCGDNDRDAAAALLPIRESSFTKIAAAGPLGRRRPSCVHADLVPVQGSWMEDAAAASTASSSDTTIPEETLQQQQQENSPQQHWRRQSERGVFQAVTTDHSIPLSSSPSRGLEEVSPKKKNTTSINRSRKPPAVPAPCSASQVLQTHNILPVVPQRACCSTAPIICSDDNNDDDMTRPHCTPSWKAFACRPSLGRAVRRPCSWLDNTTIPWPFPSPINP